MNSLETLPENYPQFSFNKGANKYRANSGFNNINDRSLKSTNSNTTSPSNSVRSSHSMASKNSGKNITSTFNTVKRKHVNETFDKYHSSKFDNLQSILESEGQDGTVVHQNEYSSTKYNGDGEKENLPWMEHVRQLKQQQQQNENTSPASDSSDEYTDTPASSVGTPPIPEPLVHSTAISSYRSQGLSSYGQQSQSPLKLFDNYNTYTQKKFDNLIGNITEANGTQADSEMKQSRNSTKTHSRDNSNGQTYNATRQVGDFINYANNVFSDCLKRGPGVASNESLGAKKISADNTTYSGSYTSDESSVSVKVDKSQRERIVSTRRSRLSHPENLQDQTKTIQNVTNNMSTFGDETLNHVETTNITHTFMKSYIEPQLVHPRQENYDMNASFMNEISAGTGRVSPKKLLKFAQHEVKIPNNVSGMEFNPVLHKWERNSPDNDRDIDELDAIADLTVTGSDKNDSIESNGSNRKETTGQSEITSESTSVSVDNITFNHLPNISNASQIDITFSQSKNFVISALIDVLSKNRNWDLVRKVELQKKNLNSLIGLANSLPNLQILNIDNNFVRNFEGVPKKIENISANNNKFSEVLTLNQFQDLEILNFSNNYFRSLTVFRGLNHLRYLNLNRNLINNISSLNNFSFQNLLSLDLSNNYIKGAIDFKKFRHLGSLQEINLSNNYVERISGVKYLSNLIIFKADYNSIHSFSYESLSKSLGEIEEKGYHQSLKKLSLKNNNIKELDLTHFKNLRVLRINQGINIRNLFKLHKLDEIVINGKYGRKIGEDFTAITYKTLRRVVEYNTIKILNVSNTKINKLEISKYLALDSLICLFNNIQNFQQLVSDIKFLSNLKKIDLRFNPITIEFYNYGLKNEIFSAYYNQDVVKQDESMEDYDLEVSVIEEVTPIIETDGFKSIMNGVAQAQWQEQDTRFLETLKLNNPSVYQKRICYQGLLLTMFKKLKYLDGLVITKERRKEILEQFKQFK